MIGPNEPQAPDMLLLLRSFKAMREYRKADHEEWIAKALRVAREPLKTKEAAGD